jgi:D-serine deaminase-like pyridoxal phosphate-dependent protein
MEIDGYRLNNAEEIDTPAFLVYEDLVQHNIDEIIRICGSAERVVTHAKTHKSSDVLKLQMARGLKSFKCATLREAEMLAENGVDEIIVAYPLLHPKKIERFVALRRQYPNIDIKAIVSTPEHLKGLSEAMGANGLSLDVYIDLDTGMRRTGAQPGEEAGALYVKAAATPALNVLGVHIFDGQTLYKPDHAERKALVDRSIEHMHDVWDYAVAHGLEVVDNVAGGSWSFQHYLNEENVRVSPGTWVYWDSRNATMTELGFKVAAVVLGQVIDRDPEMDTVTTDIGTKACAPDQPVPVRLKLIGHPAAELVAHSEEHGVIKLNGERLDVGDLVLAAPGHACTTTVKFPHALVVNGAGDVVGRYNHDARDH